MGRDRADEVAVDRAWAGQHPRQRDPARPCRRRPAAPGAGSQGPAARHLLRRDGTHGLLLYLDQGLCDAGADRRSDPVHVQPARQDDFGAGDLDLRRYPDARLGWKRRMIPLKQIDSTSVPGSDVELRLMQRGTEFSMMLCSNELMNSRLSGSEEALATLACKRLEAVKRPHLLIGGLGMGFTLRAALAVMGSGARITVAELVPAVIAWARGPLAAIVGDSLVDQRASILTADVVDVIGSHASAFDAILLDVDNGPEALIRKANDALYDAKGLKAICRALRPGGVLA